MLDHPPIGFLMHQLRNSISLRLPWLDLSAFLAEIHECGKSRYPGGTGVVKGIDNIGADLSTLKPSL